jgi:hypothetical protein
MASVSDQAAVSSVPGVGAVPEDQSLNADVPLPEDGNPDVLSSDIVGDSATIIEGLKALNEAPVIATESHYAQLRYLRDDLLGKRGMDRELATEAIALIPSFGRNRPLNHYSTFPSHTGYTAALEEIDTAMQNDVVARYTGQAALVGSLKPSSQYLVDNTKFADRFDHFKILKENLERFKDVVTSKGFAWEDKIYQASAVDPTQFSAIPDILKVSLRTLYSFIDMDDYYMTVVTAPLLLEQIGLYMQKWSEVLHSFMEKTDTAFDVKGRIMLEIPAMQPVYDRQGKEVKLEYIYDFFAAARDKCKDPTDVYPTSIVNAKFNSAAEQANIDGIVTRLTATLAKADELSGVMKQVGEWLKALDPVSPDTVFITEAASKLISLAAPNMVSLAKGIGQISVLVSNALVTLDYVNMLTIRVVQIAWGEVQKCRQTMQMSEDEYNVLKDVVCHQLRAYKAITGTPASGTA